MKLYFLVLLFGSSPVFSQDDILVKIPDFGIMQGYKWESEFTQKPYEQFLGVPYAEAPISDRRFKPANLITNLNQSTLIPGPGGIYNMQYPGPNCFQTGGFGPGSSEDCLYLNLFTPGIKKSHDQKLLPVIVFLHGGFYQFGTSVTYSGYKLLEHDVILISPNFRLSTLGFLTLDTPDAPGNAALYDAVRALEWTRKYVEYFGGDPNQVTLAGQQSGAASVNHLMISPLAKGLFSKAIINSGSAIADWAFKKDAFSASIELATLLGCAEDEISLPHTAICMQQVDPLDLDSATRYWITQERLSGRMGFELTSPTIQKPANIIGTEPFLTNDPYSILNSGDYHAKGIPLLTGDNRHEGSALLSLYYSYFIHPNNLQNNAIFLREQLGNIFLKALGVDPTPGLHDSLLDYYLEEERFSGNFTKMIPGLIDLGSVFHHKGPVLETAKLHAETEGAVYLYSFDYKGSKTIYQLSGGIPEIPGGVALADELMYVFPLTFGFNDLDKQKQREFSQIWANFATFGNPNGPDGDTLWPKWTKETQKYLKFDVESTVQENYSSAWQGVSKELMD